MIPAAGSTPLRLQTLTELDARSLGGGGGGEEEEEEEEEEQGEEEEGEKKKDGLPGRRFPTEKSG